MSVVRKILKYILKIFLYLFLVLLILPALLYIPSIQDFAKNKALVYASENFNIDLSIDRIRLSFPCNLTVNDAIAVSDGDTLLQCAELTAEVALLPLFKKDIVVKHFFFNRAFIHYNDTISQFDLMASVGEFSLKADKIDLGKEIIIIPSAELSQGEVILSFGVAPPDTIVKDSSSVKWKIIADQLKLEEIDFKMEMYPDTTHVSAQLSESTIEKCMADIASQYVSVKKIALYEGDFSFLSDTIQQKGEKEDTTLVSNSKPWTLSVEEVSLQKTSFDYGLPYGVPSDGLDVNHLQFSDIDLFIDSLFNKGSEIKAKITNISFTERCGLQVDSLQGKFSMDTLGIYVSDFLLKTPSSVLMLDANIGNSALQIDPSAPISAQLSARLNLLELLPLVSVNEKMSKKILDGKTLEVIGNVSGELGSPNVNKLQLSLSNSFYITAEGRMRSILKPKNLNGLLRLNGRFIHTNYLVSLFEDSVLQNRIHIPDHIVMRSELRAVKGVLLPSVSFVVDGRTLDLSGVYSPVVPFVEANISCDSFPVYRFLPSDSLGLLTMDLQAKWHGKNLFDKKTRGDLSLIVDKMDYKGYDYGGLSIKTTMAEQILTGTIKSASEALRFGLDINAHLSEQHSVADIKGDIRNIDFYTLNLSSDRLSASMAMDVQGEVNYDKTFSIGLVADSIKLMSGLQQNSIDRTTLKFFSEKESVQSELHSGDMSVDFHVPVNLDSLIKGVDTTVKKISQQLKKGEVDMEEVQKCLPPFILKAEAAKKNVLNNFLKTKGSRFNNLSLKSSSGKDVPFNMLLSVNKLSSQGIVLDTLLVGARQAGKQLNYFLRLANALGNLDQMALIALYGNIVENKLHLNCFQKDRNGRQGFNFGCDAALLNSSISVKITPEHPILGFEEWSVNPDNFFIYQFDRKMYANLRLTHNEQHFLVETVSQSDIPDGSVRLDIAGIDIGTTLSVFPVAPPFTGIFNAGFLLGMDNRIINADGKILINELAYDKQRIGNINFDLLYKFEEKQVLDARLSLDDKEVVSAQGSYQTENNDSLQVEIRVPAFPLSVANAFIPSDFANVSGFLNGDISLSGDMQHLLINGGLQFSETEVKVPLIGTAFRFSGNKIPITENKLLFSDYSIIAPNQQPLLINGEVNLSNFSRIMTDLTLNASNFQMINVEKSRKSMLYGKANLNMNATLQGPVDELWIRGNAQLLNGTEINYVLNSSPFDIKQEKQNIVTFMSFNDTTNVDEDEVIQQVKIGGMNVFVNVGIDDEVKMAVNLSEDGQNRINLQGGGNLTYTLNQLGDSRFSGRYVLTGGMVRYNPPIISEKIFAISEGSFVEWNGNIADPTLNITAVETVSSNVTIDEQNSRTVKFNLSIKIKNTLENLSITMDLSAPGDITIQNQLSSMTAEQRATQAMNLLISNTYMAPGTDNKVNVANPLNTFIQKELNQWAQNNLKNVDLSFGVNSYNEISDGTETSRTDYSYKLSKSLFDNRFRVIIGGRFSTDSDPSENLKENLIDDISLEYVIGKRDNMFVKLFRHTGYESILEGEVTQTGFGFVVRKKLRKLRYLFRLTKNSDNKGKNKSEKKNLSEIEAVKKE